LGERKDPGPNLKQLIKEICVPTDGVREDSDFLQFSILVTFVTLAVITSLLGRGATVGQQGMLMLYMYGLGGIIFVIPYSNVIVSARLRRCVMLAVTAHCSLPAYSVASGPAGSLHQSGGAYWL